MGRPGRIQFPGACYLVTLQGNNRQDIFLTSQDRRFYLSLLRSSKDRYDLKVYAFCLMPSSVSLLIETGQGNLSTVMQGFNTLYTKYFNGAHNTTGHVFQGRYKAWLVDKENYLAEMTSYVHLDPFRAGLTPKPWRYQWSSGPAYVEARAKEPLVDSEVALKRFGKTRFSQSLRYLHYLKKRMKTSFQPELPIHDGLYIGTPAFASRTESAAGRHAAPIRLVDADKILAETASRHGLQVEAVMGRGQWREITSVRKEAMYLLWKEGMTITEIARFFKRTASAVSQVIRAHEQPFLKISP